jgi:Tol biopolymer transport system component
VQVTPPTSSEIKPVREFERRVADLEALIEEARKRARRRRRLNGAAALLLAAAGVALVIGFTGHGRGGSGRAASERAGVAGTRGRAQRIAFSRFEQDGTAQIYALNADGSALRRLTSGPYRNAFPAWSPNRTMIAFTRSSPRGTIDNPGIYVMRANGSGQRLVATGTPALAWSPDGSRIAFWRFIPRTHPSVFGIYIVDDAGDVRLVERNASFPAWSPDGSKLAFVAGATRISVMSVDGSHVRVLARGFAPAWSPDGRKIAYIGLDGYVDHTRTVWVMNADGTHRTRLAVRSWEDCDLTWSPNGKQLAFTNPEGLFLISPTGKDLRRLARGNVCGIAW